MKKIVNGNSYCVNCINYNKEDCASFADKMVKKGLNNCINADVTVNYIYEKETKMKLTKMKLTKEQKQHLKFAITDFTTYGGTIAVFKDSGVIKVYFPTINGKNTRMYSYGMSVCNPKDKFNKKYGIYLALQNYYNTDKLITREFMQDELDLFPELIY